MATTLSFARRTARSTPSSNSVRELLKWTLSAGVLLALLIAWPHDASAYSGTPSSVYGSTNKPGSVPAVQPCSNCHGSGAVVTISGASALNKGQTGTYSVSVTRTATNGTRVGVDIASSDATVLGLSAGQPTVLQAGANGNEVIHSTSAGSLKTTTSNTASYNFTVTVPSGAASGASYTLFATGAVGFAGSGQATAIVVKARPTAPTSVTASGITTTSVNLAWSGTGPEYRVVYKTGGTPPASETDGTTLDLGTGTSTTVSGLTNATQYSFAVFSKLSGEAIFSSTAATTTATTTAAVVGPRFVNAATGVNTGDCRTSGSPCKTITYAMSQAATGNPGDAINVAAGTYNAALGEVFPIVITSGVQLQATGTAANTIVDATGANKRLFNAIGSNASTVIQGFTITGGFHEAPVGTNIGGGAILIDQLAGVGAQIKIRRNIFSGNTVRGFMGAAASFSKEAYGGAIVSSGSSPTIENNVFNANTAWGGDGVAGTPGGDAGSAHGGAIFICCNAATIVNNTFYGNVARGGSGGSSSGQGGAGGTAFNGAVDAAGVSVVNNIFVNNSAIAGTGGSGSPPGSAGSALTGALQANSSPSNTNNLFFGNTSNGDTGTNSVLLDPQFLSAPTNLRIGLGSPARAAGTATGAPAIDLDGTSRPATPSIGAFEASSLVVGPRYVNAATGSNTGTCTTQASPCKTITYAMDQAASGDAVNVAPGTYNAALGEAFPIFVKSGVQLTSTGTAANTTIDATGANARVLELNSTNASTIVEKFTIKGGLNQPAADGSGSAGGGMRIIGGSPTIRRNIFLENEARGYTGIGGSFPSGGQATGGGIYMQGTTATIVNNVFRGNIVRGGAGVSYQGLTTPGGSAGGGTGGAIYTVSGASVIINNTFYGNSAIGGAGGFSLGAGGYGGNGYAGAVQALGASVVNNIFVNNSAVRGAGGNGSPPGGAGDNAFGALSYSDAPSDANNLFFGNTAPLAISSGDTVGSNFIVGDPLFHAAPDNLRILVASPANASGTATGAPTTDFDGTTRPNPPSRGAFEASKLATTTALALSSGTNPSTSGQSVTFTATVTGTGATPTGTVTFKDGTTTICATVALASGQAPCATSSLAAGTRSITAEYSGDATYVASTSSMLSQVVKLTSTTALASGTNPSTSGQSVTFTATVSGGGGTATGTVTFKDGTTAICSGVALGSGQAQCTTSNLSAGTRSMTAEYSGDSVYVASTSSALSQVVQTPSGSFALSVTKAGTGGGTVTSSPAGIDCGSACVANFTSGASVSLAAAAAPGAAFAGWSGGGCSGTGGCTVTMSAATSVTATFTAFTTFNVLISGSQEVPSNAVGASGSGTATVNPVANTITYSFSVTGLSGSLAGVHFHGPAARGVDGGVKIDIGSAPFSGTVNYNEADEAGILNGLWYVNYHTAAFPGGEVRGQLDNLGGPATFNLTVSKTGTGTGTVTSSPAGINCGSTCTASFGSGVAVTLTATAATGSAFAGWSGGGCTGTGQCTVAMSATTTVTATFSNPPRLANISTRMAVLTGDNVLIGGFIIGGSSSKTIVVRARGPSLTAAGVPNALVNPVLSLFSGQTVIASNDDFATAANAAQLQASGFAPSNAQEAAILITLNPGPYTAIVSGAGGTTGVGLIEVFEVDAFTVPLINIATRGPVLTGNDVMIGGFIIQGSGPQTVVVRARGPSLTALGVPGALANPVLSLFSGQTVIASNDDWQTASNASTIQSSGFAPSNPQESAIYITLNPGAYTAIVTGAGGTTGVGIVEVFAVP